MNRWQNVLLVALVVGGACFLFVLFLGVGFLLVFGGIGLAIGAVIEIAFMVGDYLRQKKLGARAAL